MAQHRTPDYKSIIHPSIRALHVHPLTSKATTTGQQLSQQLLHAHSDIPTKALSHKPMREMTGQNTSVEKEWMQDTWMDEPSGIPPS